MANPYSIELRERVVGAYEAGIGSYPEIAKLFNLGETTVERWVWRKGMWSLTKKGGSTESTICLDELAALVGRLGDANTNEITAEYNRGRCKAERRHVSSIKRALHRAGFVVKKKRVRPLEQLRPDVIEKRKQFREKIESIAPEWLDFLHRNEVKVFRRIHDLSREHQEASSSVRFRSHVETATLA